MRLFEVDLGSARDVLAVLQGQANRSDQPSTLPFPVVMNILKPYGLGISTPDGLIALKNAVDPAGDVIADILDDGSVLLKTNATNPNQDQAAQAGGSSPALDAMASRNAKKLKPDI
jgi:hypothetical protein